jgi:cobalt-precorrin 5A hydrolase/precorrin-3B C17-methyltransferase
MLTLVLVGNSSSRIQDGRMVTPRGYPGAELA